MSPDALKDVEYWLMLALPAKLPSDPNVAVMALDAASDSRPPLPLLYVRASHSVSLERRGLDDRVADEGAALVAHERQ